MINQYEIERKFLVKLPNINELNVREITKIIQTYLTEGENNLQRRVRKIDCNGEISYTYTEKHFITAITRKELEYNINEVEYLRLIKQARTGSVPVEKTRFVFEYKNQLFELDVYPFSDMLAIMELELNAPDQQIYFPDNIEIVKEVTEDGRYANAALADAGAFPEEYPA